MKRDQLLIDTRYRLRLDDEPKAIVTPVKLMNIMNDRSVTVKAVWDTGATFSSVSRRVIDELDLDPMSPCITNGVNGPVTGMTRIVLTFPGNTRFAAWAEMSEVQQLPQGLDVLLGLDIISLGDMHLSHEPDGLWFEFVFRQETFIDFEADDKMAIMRKMVDGLKRFKKQIERD